VVPQRVLEQLLLKGVQVSVELEVVPRTFQSVEEVLDYLLFLVVWCSLPMQMLKGMSET
jgi:hypothetical protein